MKLGKPKFDYKWIVLGMCFMMVFVCLGFCSGNKGLYLTAITEALGIKRSLFSINDSCRYIATAVINLFFGSLLHRYGVRKMIGFGFAALIASMLIYAYAESVYVFCIGGTLLGVGLAFTSTTIASSLIRRWFKKDVGRYTGIVLAANGIGSAVAAQIVSPMINQEGNPFGYRTSFLVVAGILAVVGLLVVLLIREWPKNEDLVAGAADGKKKRIISWAGIDFNAASRRPFFYIAMVVVFFNGLILQGISGIYAAHMKDVGIDAGYVAMIVSVFSLALTGSKILVGALYDRYGLSAIMILCQGATVIAFVFMLLLNNTGMGLVFAVLFALLYALALPLETLVVPLIASDMFGTASFDKFLGIMIAVNYAGYALGAPVTNICYDALGSYKPIFLIFAAMMVLACVVFQFAIPEAHKEQEKLLAGTGDPQN
jgi:MFS family permease